MQAGTTRLPDAMNDRSFPMPPARPCPTYAEVDHLAGLSRIFDADCHLVRLRCRRPASVIVDYLHAAHASGALRSGRQTVIDAGGMPDANLLPDLPGRSAVYEDIRLLSELLADLTDCPRVGVRIEVLDRAMCPHWHVDRVGLRLLSTWIGPATEWLSEADADRDQLGTDAVMPHPSALRCALPGDILVLKGENWPGNAGHGVIHRSPALTPAQPLRIIAALDALFPMS